MIDLYYWPTPNGHKITMFLEEAGLAYRIVPVDISSGDQFKPQFLAFSPNNRMPAIIDSAPANGCPPTNRGSAGTGATPRFNDPTSVTTQVAGAASSTSAIVVGR